MTSGPTRDDTNQATQGEAAKGEEIGQQAAFDFSSPAQRPTPNAVTLRSAPPPEGFATLPTPELLGPGQVLDRLGRVVADAFPEPFWLAGEVTALSAEGPHLYLTLTDETDAESPVRPGQRGPRWRIKVAAFGLDARRIRSRMSEAGLRIERGMSVRVYGHLHIWTAAGTAQLRAIDIDYHIGLGRAEANRRAAVAVICGAGLADHQKALPTPPAPLRVAVISPAGQGLDDFSARLAQTPWAWQVDTTLCPSEGPSAAERLAAAVRHHAAQRIPVDVIVVTRGGGDATLDAYDDPAVIMAVADSVVPVIVAVGPHNDRPLVEMVTWRAEATPTAAAVCLDRIVAAQADELTAQMAGLLDDAALYLATQARLLDREWHQARLALERARRPAAPAPTSPVAPQPAPFSVGWRAAAVAAAALAAAVILALLALAGVL